MKLLLTNPRQYKGCVVYRVISRHMFTLYSLSLFQRAHISLMVLYGSQLANDLSTANGPQNGLQIIPRQGLYRKRWYLRRISELVDGERNEWTQEFGQGIYFIHYFC